MNHDVSLSVLLGAMISAGAYAQDARTVGELLSKGGKKLTRAEITSLYDASPTVSGVSPAGNRKFELTYSRDGTLSGRSTDLEGQRGYGLFGTWTVNDAAQVCSQLKNAFGRDATPSPPCGFRYKLGDAIYSAGSEDPDAALRPLLISK